MGQARVCFLIAGVQKSGTTALASYLGEHLGVCLPIQKEAHVFDDPDAVEDSSASDIDARYSDHYPPAPAGVLYGDATPIYSYWPGIVERVYRYNPTMKWILLLRHPVDRAISHYHMERLRGSERLPLNLAFAVEAWRLWRDRKVVGETSARRIHSYRERGRYVRQIEGILCRFPPEQLLLLRSCDLAERPAEVLLRVYDFLGLEPPATPLQPRHVFEGRYDTLPANSWTRHFWFWLCRRECQELARRYGIEL